MQICVRQTDTHLKYIKHGCHIVLCIELVSQNCWNCKGSFKRGWKKGHGSRWKEVTKGEGGDNEVEGGDRGKIGWTEVTQGEGSDNG